MADIVDIEDSPSEFDAIDEKLKQEHQKLVEQKAKELANITESAKTEPELPEKYKGKTMEDVIRMHQEAEKTIGRQGQEVGEVRRLADELLKSQLTSKPEQEKPKVDFFENPDEAIRLAVENNPKVIAAEEYAIKAQRELASQVLLNKHPDALEIWRKDENFGKWVQASQIRMELAKKADSQWDFNSADELLSTYKQLYPKKIESSEVKADKISRETILKNATVDVGGSSESSQKVYRRADLIRLKMRDPSRYDAMQEDIMRAYQEGRVR